MKRFSLKHSIESRCHRTGKCTICRRVRASFSPEVLQAGAVKGLKAFMAFRIGAVNVTIEHDEDDYTEELEIA